MCRRARLCAPRRRLGSAPREQFWPRRRVQQPDCSFALLLLLLLGLQPRRRAEEPRCFWLSVPHSAAEDAFSQVLRHSPQLHRSALRHPHGTGYLHGLFPVRPKLLSFQEQLLHASTSPSCLPSNFRLPAETPPPVVASSALLLLSPSSFSLRRAAARGALNYFALAAARPPRCPRESRPHAPAACTSRTPPPRLQRSPAARRS
mmetsp:Transcript_26060/g.65686  ORF Transcript_26060/g.65686 Transcript_26060/m.65686 type:complete len:204 (-) Transcript_26060:1873-2484(-)